jgi:hypothetical protein
MFAAELSLAVETEHHRAMLLADAERFRLARIARAARRVARRRRRAAGRPPEPPPPDPQGSAA